MRLPRITFDWVLSGLKVLSRIPSEVFPEIRLPCPAPLPPIVLLVAAVAAPRIWIPLALGIAAVPASLVPM